MSGWNFFALFIVTYAAALFLVFQPFKKRNGWYIKLNQRQLMNVGGDNPYCIVRGVEDGYVYFYNYYGLVCSVKEKEAVLIKFIRGEPVDA